MANKPRPRRPAFEEGKGTKEGNRPYATAQAMKTKATSSPNISTRRQFSFKTTNGVDSRRNYGQDTPTARHTYPASKQKTCNHHNNNRPKREHRPHRRTNNIATIMPNSSLQHKQQKITTKTKFHSKTTDLIGTPTAMTEI